MLRLKLFFTKKSSEGIFVNIFSTHARCVLAYAYTITFVFFLFCIVFQESIVGHIALKSSKLDRYDKEFFYI